MRRIPAWVYWPTMVVAFVLGIPGSMLRALRRAAARIGDTTGRIAELEAQVRRFDGILRKDPEIIRAPIEEGSAEVQFRHPFACLYVEAFARMLDDPRAINFVTATMESPRHGRFEVIVQRAHGKTPSEVIGDLQARIAVLEGKL